MTGSRFLSLTRVLYLTECVCGEHDIWHRRGEAETFRRQHAKQWGVDHVVTIIPFDRRQAEQRSDRREGGT